MQDDELVSKTIEVQGPLHSTRSPKDGEPTDIIEEKLLQWQQARIQRQLKGEYQSQVFRLNELVGGNLDTPLSISGVRIEGAKTTRPGFLSRVVSPYLAGPSTSSSSWPFSAFSNDDANASSYSDSTLQTVLHQTRQITHALQRTELFKRVTPELATPRDPLASARDVDILFRVQERGRFAMKSATEIGNNDASASATVIYRNAFGGAEVLEGSASFGMKTQHTYRLSLSAPLTANMLTRGEISAYAIDNDYHSWTSCKEGLKGVKAAVSTVTRLGLHEVSYQAVLRHVHSLKPDAPFSIRQAAGTSFKSSLYNTFTHDSRDDAIMGTKGHYFKLSQELAGLGGDTAFAKAEGETQISRQLFEGLHVSFAARAGFMYGLGKDSTTMFNDRFKLGGPLTVRSFKFNSIGPRDNGDAIGGDAYWATGLSFMSNLPGKPHWPLKPHFYINAGRLGTVDRSQSFPEALRSAVDKPSVSAGIGLIYRFDPVRLEVNFGMPLAAHPTDGYQRGFQIGFGLEYL